MDEFENAEMQIKELLKYFKENKKSTLVIEYNDKKSAEYEFSGITLFDIPADLQGRTAAYKTLSFDDDTSISIVRGNIEEATLSLSVEEIDVINNSYDNFKEELREVQKSELKDEVKVKKKPNRSPRP